MTPTPPHKYKLESMLKEAANNEAAILQEVVDQLTDKVAQSPWYNSMTSTNANSAAVGSALGPLSNVAAVASKVPTKKKVESYEIENFFVEGIDYKLVTFTGGSKSQIHSSVFVCVKQIKEYHNESVSVKSWYLKGVTKTKKNVISFIIGASDYKKLTDMDVKDNDCILMIGKFTKFTKSKYDPDGVGHFKLIGVALNKGTQENPKNFVNQELNRIITIK